MSLLAVMGFNTNLVQILLLYHVILSNIHICSFMPMILQVEGRAPKTILHAQNLVDRDL